MKTQIISVHFETDPRLETLIYERLEEIEKLFPRIESCDVILKHDKNDKNLNNIAEININVPGSRLFASMKAETFEMAIPRAIEKIKRRLRKHTDKLQNKKVLI
jgi:putative sigma-54 modulation protein